MYYFEINRYHIFNHKSKYFLLVINNLALLEINKLSYEILKCPSPIEPGEIMKRFIPRYNENEIQGALNALLEWNVLSNTDRSTAIEEKIPRPFPQKIEERWVIANIYLTIAQDCNLRCKYCSAEYGRFGKKTPLKYMSKETAVEAIDFLLNNIDPTQSKPLITFIGGEPLMNFDVLQATVEYCRSKKGNEFRFFLNTNGTLMTEQKAKWFTENKVPIRFSIDGLKEIHDSSRIYPNETGSYEDVMLGLKNYQKYSKHFTVQSSIPHGDRLVDSVHSLWSLGASNVLANFTGESPFLENDEMLMNSADEIQYLTDWETLVQEITERLIQHGYSPVVHMAEAFLKVIHKKSAHPPGCGTGRSISITPEGDIYPCHGFVGFDDYIIGNIRTGIDSEKMIKFYDTYIKFLTKCDGCWARYACGCACVGLAVQYNELGDKFPSSRLCNIYKGMIESCIYMYSRLKEERPDIMNKLFPSESKKN